MANTKEHCDVCGKELTGTFKAVIDANSEHEVLCSMECLENWTQKQRLSDDADQFLDLGEFVDVESDKLDGEEQGLEEIGEHGGEQETFYRERKSTEAFEEYGMNPDDDEYGAQKQTEEGHEPPQHPLDPYKKQVTEEHASDDIKGVPYQPEVVEGKELTESIKKKEQETVKQMLQELYEKRMKQRASDEKDEEEGVEHDKA